jgi:hypothetical protein
LAHKIRNKIFREEKNMLWLIFTVLLLLWLLGMVSSYTFGGFLHILLVVAIAAVLIRIIQGRRAL